MGEFHATSSKQLSKKLKIFSQFCTTFQKSTFNFDHCEKKDEPRRLYISEVTDGEKRVYVNV